MDRADQAGVSTDEFRGLLFRTEPDYSAPQLEIPEEASRGIRARLAGLYGVARVDGIYSEVERLMRVHYAYETPVLRDLEDRLDPRRRFTERDVILITYGDMIVSADRRPLRTLADFVEVFFRGIVNTLHILPFYPYSSDRGFSVISYEEVDPRFGSWEEIEELEAQFKLMFDAVFNHVSSKSYWFHQYLAGNPEYQDFFTVFRSHEAVAEDHLRLLMRPRTSDVLTRYDTIDGPSWVWTTFSPDQIDLNFKNPKVLLKVLEILLFYVRKGADLLRLDAVTYLWCDLGTSCAHLWQTHQLVKLIRDVLDLVNPHVALVTETNVPHSDNITYFGNGNDEAQMVYNFALPPLVLHTFQTGDVGALSRWAAELEPPSDTTAFFNFLDSHDGIGLMGVRGILGEDEILAMCDRVRANGGLVSMKSDGDGGESPYEFNITWFSALNGDGDGEPVELQVDRFIASRAVALAVRGVPGIYLPSFFGSKNDVDAVCREGSKRAINRTALEERKLFEAFADPNSVPARIAAKFVRLLEIRVGEAAFHPRAGQQVLDLDPRVFAVLRRPQGGGDNLISLINVTRDTVDIELELSTTSLRSGAVDLVSGVPIRGRNGSVNITLAPYGVLWLR